MSTPSRTPRVYALNEPTRFRRAPRPLLRIGEALGLTWADVDYDAGVIRVRRQLTRKRLHAPLKTQAGKREVILAPTIARLLREHWLVSRFKRPDCSAKRARPA